MDPAGAAVLRDVPCDVFWIHVFQQETVFFEGFF